MPYRLSFLREQEARDICSAVVHYIEDGGTVTVESSHDEHLVITLTILNPDLYHPILARLVGRLSHEGQEDVA